MQVYVSGFPEPYSTAKWVRFEPTTSQSQVRPFYHYMYATVWLGGVVVRAWDLRLEIAGSIPAAALSSATLDTLFTHIVQRP